jgi:hypothetical protein
MCLWLICFVAGLIQHSLDELWYLLCCAPVTSLWYLQLILGVIIRHKKLQCTFQSALPKLFFICYFACPIILLIVSYKQYDEKADISMALVDHTCEQQLPSLSDLVIISTDHPYGALLDLIEAVT